MSICPKTLWVEEHAKLMAGCRDSCFILEDDEIKSVSIRKSEFWIAEEIDEPDKELASAPKESNRWAMSKFPFLTAAARALSLSFCSMT